MSALVTLDFTPAAHQPAGIGRYAQQLALALMAEQAELNFFYCAPEVSPQLPPQTTVRHFQKSVRSFRWLAAQSHFFRQPQDALLPAGHLFHATDHTLPFLARPSILTVYDVTPHTYPHLHQPLNRWYNRLFLPVFIRHTRRVLAISEHTRQQLIHWLPWAEEKIIVTPLAADVRFTPISNAQRLTATRARYNLPEAFVLALGTLEPRKNLVTLLEAYAALLAHQKMPTLVLIGKTGWKNERMHQRLRELRLENQVRLLGYIPDTDLPDLLSAATVFVYPSLYEGFGLPPLEALACGTPVICSNSSSLPEVVGDAAVLVDPQVPADIAQTLSRVLGDKDLQADLRARGPVRAARFTWKLTAQATLQVYRSVMIE